MEDIRLTRENGEFVLEIDGQHVAVEIRARRLSDGKLLTVSKATQHAATVAMFLSLAGIPWKLHRVIAWPWRRGRYFIGL